MQLTLQHVSQHLGDGRGGEQALDWVSIATHCPHRDSRKDERQSTQSKRGRRSAGAAALVRSWLRMPPHRRGRRGGSPGDARLHDAMNSRSPLSPHSTGIILFSMAYSLRPSADSASLSVRAAMTKSFLCNCVSRTTYPAQRMAPPPDRDASPLEQDRRVVSLRIGLLADRGRKLRRGGKVLEAVHLGQRLGKRLGLARNRLRLECPARGERRERRLHVAAAHLLQAELANGLFGARHTVVIGKLLRRRHSTSERADWDKIHTTDVARDQGPRWTQHGQCAD